MIESEFYNHSHLAGHCYGVGFSRWKQSFIADFVGPNTAIDFISEAQLPPLEPTDQILVWSSKLTPELARKCSAAKARIWLIEDGFIRSVGLGVDLVRPLSLVLDSRGIYYDSTGASDLETLLNEYAFTKQELQQAQAIRHKLIALGITKYNVGYKTPSLPQTKHPLILVPGQVETDASIALGSPKIKTNHALLEAVRTSNPDAHIIYKPHPDVLSGARIGALTEDCSYLFDTLVTDIAMSDLLKQVDEVHTLTSLTGFEALLRGLKVTCHGLPFYAGWGLTVDKITCPRRTRTLTLDELVSAALALYPTYVDPTTHQRCDVEQIIDLLAKQKRLTKGIPLHTRAYRLLRKWFEPAH